MTDPVADLLARIRNGLVARHEELKVPHSQLKLGIVKILYEEGYLAGYQVVGDKKETQSLQIRLRYTRDKKPMIGELDRISTPGRRIYRGYKDLRPVKNGVGFSILSTPKGILTDVQAKAEKVGGEVLCTIS